MIIKIQPLHVLAYKMALAGRPLLESINRLEHYELQKENHLVSVRKMAESWAVFSCTMNIFLYLLTTANKYQTYIIFSKS